MAEPMKTIKMLREERQKLFDEANSYVILAREEERELAKEEVLRVDEILGTADKDGLLQAKDVEIARAERLEAIQKQAVADRAVAQNRFVNEGVEPEDRKIILPAMAKRKVKHFDSPEDAYSAGQFIAASIFGSKKAKQWCDEHGMGIKAAHNTFDNEKGGYLVPETMETAIIRLVEERGVFRRSAFVYPMGSDAATIPRRSSGFTVYYPGEGKELTASDMTLNQVKLSAKKAAILTAISSELDEHAVSMLASLLTEELAFAFASAEDNEGFNGDGTSAFGGTVGLKNVLNAGSIVDAASGNVSLATLDLADFRKAIGRLPQFPGMSPVWYMHSSVYHNGAAPIMDAAGGNTSANIAAGTAQQFLGYPVQFVQSMVADTAVDVSTIVAYIGDLNMAATMGTRRGVTITSDSSVYFTSDQIAIKGTQRYDINIHERGTDTTGGPIVALKTAAS